MKNRLFWKSIVFLIFIMLAFSLTAASKNSLIQFLWMGDKANPLVKEIDTSIDKNNGFDKIVYLSISIKGNDILRNMGDAMLYIDGIDAINPSTKLFGNKWHGTCMIQNRKIENENDKYMLVAFQTKTDSITLKTLGFSSFQLGINNKISSTSNIDFPINKTFKLINNSLNYLGRISIVLVDKDKESTETYKQYGTEIWREVKNEITYIQYIEKSDELKENDLAELLLIKKALNIPDELKASNVSVEMQ